MKKLIFGSLFSILLLPSCKNEKKIISEQEPPKNPVATTQENDKILKNSETFDINSLPVSDRDLGQFPYYTTPDWLKSGNYSEEKELDFSKFEIYTGSGFYPAEGKVSVKYFNDKKNINQSSEGWNEYKFVESFRKHFESLGAKKIWEGTKPWEDFDNLDKEKNRDDYSYEYSSEAMQENQLVYGMKHRKTPLFFIIASDASYGSVTVVESASFVQTVTVLKSDQIQKELSEKGKAVLHINFDTDRATLNPEGKLAVDEIAGALKADDALKIAINGYTDNTGNEAHNLQLSKDRAATVLAALVTSGIDKDRLSSNGFGDKNPISQNDTEEGKAQNRRVELIRK